MGAEGSPEKPVYKKVQHDEPSATRMFFITVDEGWRTWILCTDMYEKVADQLINILNESPRRWDY